MIVVAVATQDLYQQFLLIAEKQTADLIMNQPVKLREIIEAIDLQIDEMTSYFNTITAQIITISDEEIGAAEEGDFWDDYPEWHQDNIRIARDFLENEDDYLALPTSPHYS